MKHNLSFILLTFCLASSFVLAQVDKATGTVTNDATQARLRVGHFVFGGPNIDVLINGEIAMNPGQAQADIPAAMVTGYMYLSPGTYSVAIVPTGKSIDEALIGPVDMQLETGHRYTLAMMGQLDDSSVKPLVIDETAVLQESRTDKGQFTLTVINNAAGTTVIDFFKDGGGPQDVKYGDFATTSIANGDSRVCNEFAITLDDTTIVSEPMSGKCGPDEPGMDFIVAFMGHFPGEDYTDTQSGNTSALNALEFMKGFSGVGYEQDGHVFSFDTFLAAMETAGLTDLLSTGGPYLLYVPTDEAFAALPKEQLDSLMADPKALADVLRYTIIEGYIPQGSLSSTTYGGVDRTVKNMLGDDLKLLVADGLFTINGIAEGSIQRYQVANGSFVRPIPMLVLPPSQ
jgi:Fasciclin domain/Domain of unknown function (DUF4397)